MMRDPTNTLDALPFGDHLVSTTAPVTTTGPTPSRQHALMRAIMKAFTPFHRSVLRLTRGRIGQAWSSTRQPLLILTATGRRSGQPHSTVVGYIPDGDAFIIVASKGGLPEHPAWYHNIVANPDVIIERNGPREPRRARVTRGEERERLWRKICALYPTFASYQASTTRQLPVILLEPVA